MTASAEPGQGLSWAEYVDWLVERHGSLAGAAQRLAGHRGWIEDALSIERALRRLRSRGHRDGGVWGTRALAAFGLPGAVDARVRWMGAYHSRFTDMPLPICRDLLRLWDRPPVSDAYAAITWLGIGHATCALRADDREEARMHLRRASSASVHAPIEARIELALAEAFVASREAPHTVATLLAKIEPLFAETMPSDDRACLYARWIDQQAYELNRSGRHDEAEALHRSIPVDGAPPFVLSRRANGLAYERWKLGHRDEAITYAREAATHAGDGGHLRLRAMALRMLARIGDLTEAQERAVVIASSLDDEQLLGRFSTRPPSESTPRDASDRTRD